MGALSNDGNKPPSPDAQDKARPAYCAVHVVPTITRQNETATGAIPGRYLQGSQATANLRGSQIDQKLQARHGSAVTCDTEKPRVCVDAQDPAN